MNRTWLACLVSYCLVGCAVSRVSPTQDAGTGQQPAGHFETYPQQVPAEQGAQSPQTQSTEPPQQPAAEKVTAGHAIALWLPNRIFDIFDLVRARVRIGPGFGFGARATELADINLGGWSTFYVGLPGPRAQPEIPWPFGLEAFSGAELSVFDGTTQGDEHSPRYGAIECGAGVQVIIVGVDVGVDVWEAVDLLVGFAFFDPMSDDF